MEIGERLLIWDHLLTALKMKKVFLFIQMEILFSSVRKAIIPWVDMIFLCQCTTKPQKPGRTPKILARLSIQLVMIFILPLKLTEKQDTMLLLNLGHLAGLEMLIFTLLFFLKT